MLIQNISGTAPALGLTSDSTPAPVVAPKTQTTPTELPRVAIKAAEEKQAAQPTPSQLKNAVDGINEAMKRSNSNVEFSIDKDTKQTVIRVVESGTGQVIRQFPSEEILAVSRMIAEEQHGALLRQKV